MPKLLGHEIPSCEDLSVIDAKVESLSKTVRYHQYIIAALVGAILIICFYK